MITLIKDTLYPFYSYLRRKEQREFIKILDSCKIGERYIGKEIHFLEYSFYVTDPLSFAWQFKEIFVDEIYKFHPITDSPLIFDCGANVGVSCAYFKRFYSSSVIKAFEADPKICYILKKNLITNGIIDVEVINKVVWINGDGTGFSSDGGDSGSICGDKNDLRLESVRLKNLIDEQKKIDMLKIDIEGAEAEVLWDCRDSLSIVENIFIEYHSWHNQRQKLDLILNILTKNGFRYYMYTIHSRKNPFISKSINLKKDLQVNIFGFRI